MVNGPLGKTSKTIAHTANFIKADLQLKEQFESYCDMEFNDAAHDEARSMSANDKRAMELMINSIILEDGHYQLSLPWRNDPPCLDNNRSVAEHRLQLLRRCLLKDPELWLKYNNCIDDLLKKGYGTKAQTVEIQGKTWYLPHHAVQHPAKPGKV